jgi:hypothetical protein
MHLARLSILPLLLACAACEGSGGSSSSSAGGGALTAGCKLGFLGDPAKPVEMELIARGKDRSSVDLVDGGPVPMLLPPQGGRVIVVGVRATNLAACGLELKGVLRDSTTNRIVLDGRTINLEPTGDGWGASVAADMSTFANIAICPNQWASWTNIYGTPFDLTVSITDGDGRTAQREIEVVPFCAEPSNEDECMCMCQKDYTLGQACGGGP